VNYKQPPRWPRKFMLLFATFLAFAGAAAIFVGQARGSESVESVKSQIADALRSSGQLSGYQIGIKYENGVAWLDGRVVDESQRQRAALITQSVPGVSQVVNRLELPISEEHEAGAYQNIGERVTALPEDANGCFLTVFTSDGWRSNPRELQVLGWFDALPRELQATGRFNPAPDLLRLKGQVKFNHYKPSDSMYGRYDGTAVGYEGKHFKPIINRGATGIVLQDASGTQIYWCFNAKIPADPKVLVAKIRAHLKSRHEVSAGGGCQGLFHRNKPNPCPGPCPGPCPNQVPGPQPNFTPVLPDEPDLGPDEEDELVQEEEKSDALMAILVAIAMLVVAGPVCLAIGYGISSKVDSARGG
jgi:hypothetical protein